MTAGGIYDVPHGIESDIKQLLVTSIEQEIFATNQPLSAIDVFMDARGAGTMNAIIRVYAHATGAQVLVMERNVSTNTRGRIARVRGLAVKYRVTIQGVASPGKELSIGYTAWGRGPSTDIGQDHDITPAWMPQFLPESEASVSPQLLTPGPMFLRQAYGSLAAIGTPGEVTWLQFYEGNIGNTLPGTLRAQVMLANVGQTFSLDFRDPHRLSVNNDGMYFTNGLWLVISTTPFIDSGAFTNTISLGYEIRRAPR